MMQRLPAIILIFIFFITSCSINQKEAWDDVSSQKDGDLFSPVPASITPVETDKSTSIDSLQEQTENPKKELANEKNVEAIFSLIYDWEDTEDRGKMRDTVRASFWEEDEKIAFIKAYLKERGVYKEAPDGLACDQAGFIFEYYIDKENRKISFVVQEYIEASNSTADAPRYGIYIHCTTLYWDDLEQTGSIAYDYDPNQDTFYESLYNAEEELVASVSYKYIPGVPFPLIIEHEDTDYDKRSIYTVLSRNNKFWFYADAAEFNESGSLAGYDGDMFRPEEWKSPYDHPNRYLYENHYSNFYYDTANRLEKIQEPLHAEDLESSYDYSGQCTLTYHENGSLSTAKYWCCPNTHGTWDSEGTIYYDEDGRMIYRNYYHTHGSHSCVYLYEGEFRRPWAYIEFGGMAASGEDNYEYGMDIYVYLYLPKQTDGIGYDSILSINP